MKSSAKQGSWLLPIVTLNGTDYLVDVANRRFRVFREKECVIWFYSEGGRQMIRECTAKKDWDCYGVDEAKRDA